VVILLTDGMNNSSQNNTHTINTCAELKNDDVDVYTIGFGNIGGSALSMLEDCATSEDTYFHVQNSSQLSDVFKYIATEYTFLRLSS
ncbi:MAG: VWA domain-containing protein, partial [Aquisalinus sp.]|nr:VWA domain-containing protein [Aquisalinus sp.]